MERFRVVGGGRLQGVVRVTGAKNSVLKLMAAALLAEGETVLADVPDILDTRIMAELLRRLGCRVDHDAAAATVRIDVPGELGSEADYDLVRRMRASICVLGPLLARCGKVSVARPGGDNIGSRPLDMHIAGLQKLGADVESEHGNIVATAPSGLTGATIWLDFPSVGATENILMAAVLARGTTVIDNAAREPEIVDLCLMLEQMGARISGAGTSTLEVEGVERLSPTHHVSVPDRIVAGTWAYAAAMTRGDVTVRNGRAEHLEIALDKLATAGADVSRVEVDGEPGFRVVMDGRPRAVDVVTLPFPGFATDLLPMVLALNSVAEGAAIVTENVFEARFMFVDELARLGADVRTDGHHCLVRGRERLSGAPVRAHDIRAGAGLVIAGLVADGTTTVGDAYHVDRGYPGFAEQLRSLGVEVTRETDPDADLLDG
ncbi:UDP-N-acetylglucosamine 1-carboxyvinyltransferase [Motilibacter rhizosphaerae]|uniref:UDP-N-acetylglucosamine 1-carboxyvinyltransferase n=1 Tax=Motilibacter rhizosphaerae TaxID=598652 RepID=A0A4Q7NQ31_9ACTN|nr:UDP-N-acetylglucosamine 1-carboxyvinyltransferase [Motilibacter rhizosphaerae]RZS87096.1 UDP-N-acetylglucosamine 1-carboxyvinyltransferase [Motilibacter rhizosphaerae]